MSTPTTSLLLQEINTGDQSGTWGTSVNTNMQLIDDSIAGVSSITFNGSNNYTLSNINYASDEARKMVIIANGSPGSFNQIVAPLVTKLYVVINRTNAAITIGATTGTTVSIPYTSTPSSMIVYCDGTNFYAASNSTSGTFTASTFSGAGTNLTGTAASLSIGGNAATATLATKSTNVAGGLAGGIPYQTAADTTAFLSLGTSTYVLTAGVSAPQYVSQSTLSVGSAVATTNITGGATGGLPYQTAANTTGFLALGTTNQVLTAGASGPQYVNQSTLSVGSATTATTATNVSGGAAGSLVYQSGPSTTSTLAIGSNNQVLTVSSGSLTWATPSTTATTATNLAGGTLNQIPYQTAANTTSFITAPTTGVTYLSWNGSAFSWANAGSSATTNSVTFNNGGSGASSGTAFNNSANVTVSYNTIGAQPTLTSSSNITVGTIASGQQTVTGYTGSNPITAFTTGVSVTGNLTGTGFGPATGTLSAYGLNTTAGYISLRSNLNTLTITDTAATLTNGAFSASTLISTVATGTAPFTVTSTTPVTNLSIAGSAGSIANTGGWSVNPSGTKLYFNYNGTNVGSLDSSGNFTVLGNITAYATSIP